MAEAVIDRETRTITRDCLNEKWKVIFHNDNSTPMEFVVFLLVQVFSKSMTDAATLMLTVHNHGSAVVQEYSSYDIAHQKTSEALIITKEYGYPLKITIEK